MAASFPLTKIFQDSSAIERAAYYPGTRNLDIWYEGGNHYSYYSVPPATYREFLAAESAGDFVNRQIKPRFEYRRRGPRRFRG